MMRWLLLCLIPLPAWSDAIITTRVIRAGEVIAASDLSLVDTAIPDTLTKIEDAAGQEARIILYPGKPLRASQLGPPAIIQRNQLVSITYRNGPLTISTEGRALGRGGLGDVISILNLSSRNTVTGIVMPDGSVRAGPAEG